MHNYARGGKFGGEGWEGEGREGKGGREGEGSLLKLTAFKCQISRHFFFIPMIYKETENKILFLFLIDIKTLECVFS